MTKSRAKPKAYSYLRFSTPDQAHGDSRRRQTKLAEDYATANGMELDDKLTFRDLGVSAYQGKNAKTGQLGDFLKAVEVGQVDPGSYLLVESLDRVSRRYPLDALDILKDICRKGVTLVTLSDGQEYTHESLRQNFMSLMMSLMVFQRAHEESATKAKRLRAAWDGKRGRIDAGEKMTAKVPGWLWLDKASGKIKVHKDRAKVVQTIFKLALQGVGKQSIARALNEDKVPVFGRGEQWRRSYIDKILQSSTVVGTLTPHVNKYDDETGAHSRKPLEEIAGYYPPVIEPADFKRVQAMYATPKGRRVRMSGEVRNLFGGLGRCPRCGGTMTRVNKGEPPKGGEYLVCAKAKDAAGCLYRLIPMRPLEAIFLRDIERLTNAIPSGKSTEAAKIDKQIVNLEAALDALPDQVDNLVNAIARGGKSTIALEEKLAELEIEHQPMRDELAKLKAKQASVSGKLVQRKCEELEDLLAMEPMDRPGVNALMRQLFDGIEINDTQGRMIFSWKHGGDSALTYAWPKGKGRPPLKRRARVTA